MANVATLPIAELTNTIPLSLRDNWYATLSVLDSMYLDYHDNKAHPSMSIDEHIAYCKLSEANAKFVRDNLKSISMRAQALSDAKVPKWLLKEVGAISYKDDTFNGEYLVWSMAEVTIDARHIVCFIPCLYYFDLAYGENVYKA